MRRWLPRILLGVLILLVIAVVGGYWYARPLLLTGTGYAAHNACAVTHLAGRDDPASDLPPNPLVPYLTVDVTADGASASVFGFLATQKAWFTPGFGCTLAAQRPDLGSATPAAAGVGPAAGTPTPAVDAAIGRAFGDDLDAAGKARLGTRGVVVLKGGAVVGERYAAGFTADTPQLGWSMSKSVTNLLTGRLALQGRVAPGDRNLPQLDGDKADITVDDLMRMTSGLQWDETYDLGTPITRMLFMEPDMGSYVASLPLAHPHGTYQQYSSGSTTLLCDVLGQKAGATADLPRTQLLAPLGLSRATWEPDASGTPVCGSYLWATPREWATLGQFALQDGVWNGERLLPEGWMASATTAVPVDFTEEDEGYGAGWWLNQRPDGTAVAPGLPADTYRAVGHDGQRIYVVPSANLVVVRMGFSPSVEDLRTDALVADVIAAVR